MFVHVHQNYYPHEESVNMYLICADVMEYREVCLEVFILSFPLKQKTNASMMVKW